MASEPTHVEIKWEPTKLVVSPPQTVMPAGPEITIRPRSATTKLVWPEAHITKTETGWVLEVTAR
jgi:hypothetical protein